MLPDIVMNNMCSGSMQYLSSTRRVYWSFLALVHVTVIATILHWSLSEINNIRNGSELGAMKMYD